MIEQVGRYEILEKIGEGGFAIVYRARDTALDRFIALKELRPVLLNDPDWVKRFHREAKTVAQLDHPHIVQIHDVYDAAQRLFIVMRLIDGVSLDEKIQRQGGLPWGYALDIISQVAAGLDYAHSRNILHRDLKPANILMDKMRGAMLTDFGLAKLTSQNSLSRSMSGTIVGTPHYIAPEVWEGLEFTPQADIYALGCIVYEILTGERAFKGDTPPSIMMAHFKPPMLPPAWPSGVPDDVAHIILKALSANPTERYSSAGELVAALRLLKHEEGVTPPTEGVTPVPPRAPFPAAISTAPSAPNVLPTPTPTDLVASHQELQARLSMLEESLQREKTSEQLHPLMVKEKRFYQRIGCFWGGMMVMTLMMLLTVGIVCSATENITANLSALVANFFPQVQVGQLVTQPVEIALPPGAEEDVTRLELSFSSGRLTIDNGAAPFLVQGQVNYNVEQLALQVLTDTNYVRLQTQGTIGLSNFTNQAVTNEWNLDLGPQVLDLMIEANSADTYLQLGGLALEDVTVQQNLASATIQFDEPNLIPMDDFHLNATGATIQLYNLANTQAETMGFNLGLGDYGLDFGGELETDMEVQLEGGLGGGGNIIIIMPTTTNAKVSLNGKLDELNFDAPWQKEDDHTYVLTAAGPTIYFDIRMNVGGITLQTK